MDVRPASPYAHAKFASLFALENSGSSRVDLALGSRADLVGEMTQWLRIVSTSLEGPWEWARHFTAIFLSGASDASSPAWGVVVCAVDEPFMAGGYPRQNVCLGILTRERCTP